MIKTVNKSEKGQALILVLILLLLVSLVITPLLSLMSTGLKTGQVFEEMTYELYAADAGAELALRQIKTKAGGLPEAIGDPPLSSNIVLNGKAVDVAITYVDAWTFSITAACSENGTGTTIESYVTTFDLSGFFDNAITTPGDVNASPGVTIDGPVDDEYDPDDWPTADQFRDYYLDDVVGLTPSGEGKIWVQDNPVIGPLYRVGDLIFDSFGAATVNLTGTIYVDGNLDFNQANEDYTINLNGQTIFVDGDIYVAPHKVDFVGSGCIIAVGDIDFQPLNATSDEGFVFLMSVEGSVEFKPNMCFYGAVAGYTNIDILPGGTITLPESGDAVLNLPCGGHVTVLSWKIN
ncbi:MAG TPA: hypothetical protein VMV84_04950 [Dehalococcoidales bacterium]|nr:hypothetical protein [Dehalococcoidales bacterium]